MTRDDLFGINAGIAKGIVESCAKYCPQAVLGLTVNPVNSIVPAMAELYVKKGLNPLKVIGVTTLDIVRANKFVSEVTGKPVADIQICHISLPRSRLAGVVSRKCMNSAQ